MESVEDVIRELERAREAEISAGVEACEEQRYGETPIVDEPAPLRPWDETPGTADAIRNWRKNFLCLRVRGRALLPPAAETTGTPEDDDEEEEEAWSASSEEDHRADFWNATCEVNPFEEDSEAAGPSWHISFENDALDESRVFRQQQKLPDLPAFVPTDLDALCVVGAAAPRRPALLDEEREEILAAHGHCDDYVAVSRDCPPSDEEDPDDEFPPFRRDDAALLRKNAALTPADYRDIQHAVLVLESYCGGECDLGHDDGVFEGYDASDYPGVPPSAIDGQLSRREEQKKEHN